MGAFTQSYAQSGNSCTTPISVGNLVKDTTLIISINYPDTVKWLSFSSDSSLVSFLASSNKVSIGFIKIKELNVYNTSCTSVTSNIPHSYPGKTAAIIKRANLTTNQTYLLKLVRYYSINLNDTSNREVLLNFRGGSNTGQCLEGLCNNLVYDGGFENYITPLANGAFLEDLYCWTFAEPGGEIPVYFNENYTSQLFKIPNQNTFSSGINLPTQSPDPDFFPNANTGYIGINTNQDNSDIAQGFLSTDLLPNTQYFASYLVSPGKNYSAGYHDRIDLDILNYSSAGNYDPLIWGAGYATKTPAVQSGVVDFSQPWTRVSNVFTSGSTIGESIIYIGNLAQQPYTTPIIGGAQSYYIDNLIIKPFELELGPDIVACAGETVNIIVPCQYLYPGATYIWTSSDLNFTPPANNEANLSFIATGSFSYQLEIEVTNSQGGVMAVIPDFVNVTIAPAPTIEITIGGGPQGTYCKVDGILYVVQGNQVSLTASGAGANGSYDWYVNGTLTASNQSYFFTPGLAPVGDYQIVVIGTDSLCSGSDTINLTIVSNICQLPCNTVLGQSAFVDGNNDLTNYTDGPHDFVSTSAASFNTLPLTGPNLTYVVDGTFTISTNTFLQFEEVTLLISPGGKIVNNGTFNLINCVVDGCEQMWDRIENRADFASSGTTFRHAEAAIELFENCTTRVDNSTFTDNIVGIYSRKLVNSTAQKTLFYFRVSGSTFQGSAAGINSNLRYPITFSQNTGTGSIPIQQPEFYLKPANGINIQFVSAVLIGQDPTIFSTNTNHFINMWNGITFDRTAGIITNCRFEGMEANANHQQLTTAIHPGAATILSNNGGINPNGASHYTNIHSNAIAVQNSSTLNLFSLDNDNVNLPTFRNCFRGISVLSSNLYTTPLINTDFMFFTNVNTGVRVERLANTQIVDINRLNITCHNLGVSIFPSIVVNNQGAITTFPINSIRRVHNNIINAVRINPLNLYGRPVAIQYREIHPNITNYNFNSATPLTECEINNNVINGFGAHMGIEVWNARNTIVRDNLIVLNAAQGVNAQQDYNGIHLLNTFGGEVSCNTINDNTGMAYNLQNNDNYAIRCNSALSSFVSQNTTSNFEKGIRMTEFCTGSTIRGNNIGNHSTGIFYDLVTDVGVQNHTGNSWLGSYTDYGASWGDALNIPPPLTLQNNEYRVDQGANINLMPPTRLPATGWFINLNSNGTTFIGGACNTGLLPQANSIPENILRLAQNNNDSTLYGDEKEYNAKKVLFENLENNDSLIFLSNLLQDKYDSLVYTNIRDIYELNKAIGNIYVGTINQNTSLGQLTSTKNDIWNNWLEATKNNDSLAAIDFATQLQQVNMAIDAISQQIQAAANNKRNTALNLLNSITANNIMEQNMKDVLEIYLNKVYDTYIEDLTDDATTLATIAYQCPIAGGDAVFIARMLYLYIVPDAEFNDNNICNNDANARQEKKENKTFAFNYNYKTKVYPSPSKGIVHINSKSENISSVIIKDLSGRIVYTPPINPSNINTVDCSELGNGFYLLEINYENIKSEVFKINILK